MDLTQQFELMRQQVAKNQRMLDEIKERNRQTQETIDNLRNENAQTRHRQFLKEVEIQSLILSHINDTNRSSDALLSTKKALQCLKDFDDAEKRKIEGYDNEINKMMAEFEQPNVTTELEKLDEDIEKLTKEVEESKSQLAQLKLEKECARARLERTQKTVDKNLIALMKKRCDIQMRLFNLKLKK